MKKFLKWFKNSTKIKRWLFLILIGIVLACFGFSKILVTDKLELKDLIETILTFVAGFVFLVIGIVFIQRRTLEIVIEKNQIQLNKESGKSGITDLVSEKGIYKKGPKIVVIGGGTGLNNILAGLKKYTSNLTAIISVTSYGEEKSKAQKELKLQPADNLKDGIIALANSSKSMGALMNYRFKEGKLKDFSFADIYLSAMQNIYGDFANSIEKTNEILSITGNVLPITLDEMNICAELQDGTIITQRSKIAQTVQDKVTKINRVYLNPANCKTAPGVLEAIKEADAIIIGPGSIYTDVIPNLLVKNVAKTIRESKALKIYLSNIMTEPGQTDDYSVSEHINSIVEHCGKGIVNFCISDLGEIVPEYIRKYNLMGSSTVEIDSDKIKGENVQLIKGELASIDGTHIRHDPDKTAQLIIELICTDLRFKDKHNDEQYMLLNSRLKQEKKKAKIANKKAKRIKNNKYDKHDNKSKERRKSKFSDKYQERIQSIKESEKTRLENRKIQEKAQKLIEEEESKEKERFLKETYSKKTKK